LPISSPVELWEELAAGAAAESPLWAEALRPAPDREPVFSALAPERFALGLETIYEAYLVHYGRPRLFAPADEDVALLLGDYLYAHGLVRIASLGDVEAVAALAELISGCAALRAEGGTDDGSAWVDCARRLGGYPEAAEVDRALGAHAARMG
jgi:hypothetical protein